MRRTTKKRGRSGLIFIMILCFTLAILLGIMLFLELRGSEKEPIYQYASMSEEATARAYVWLNQIEDMPLSYGEIRKLMGDIQLQMVLTPTEEKGVYARSLAEGSYMDCVRQAQNGLGKAYREVVRYRLINDGYEGEIQDSMLDDMMREAYGVSVAEYLEFCDVQLLSALEEVTEMYSGEVTNE